MFKHGLRLLTACALAWLIVLPIAGCSAGHGGSGSEESAADSDAATDDAGSDAEGDEEAEDERVPVEVATLERGRIQSLLRFSTNLEAENEVQVFSKAAGIITGLAAEEGDDVRKGQVLLRLEDELQRTQVARIESQLAKARREYERQQNLFDQQLISEQVFNQATYDLEQLELALADANRELGYTLVRAPISGTVTQRLVNRGDQITMNQQLFDIVDFDSIVARIYVPEKVLPQLATGQQANLFADALGDGPRAGQVERIAPVVDSRTGTVKVTVGIPRNRELLPGMYVSVELITATRDDAILVPKKALVYDDEQIYVFRLKKDESEDNEWLVERLLLEASLEDREYIEPAGGVTAGDRIVVAGQAGLKDDAAVRIVGDVT